ncbi:metallopeptidase TldD-related protein [Natronorarus salvus]|uniref:metallopeptidase TldD-related protein n=1 Tax=Natronorarus salvus TaxID=3117733 RepID=UPI002F26599D
MDTEAVVDAATYLAERLEDDGTVAHAVVGGEHALRARIDVTERRKPKSAIDVEESGVWCRVFAHGSVEYRHSGSLEREELDRLAERAVSSCRHLATDTPVSFDAGSLHRDVHHGWASADDHLDDRTVEEKADDCVDAFSAHLDAECGRARLRYRDECRETTLLETSGSAVRTRIDRASVDATLADDGAVRTHLGTTNGTAIFEELPVTLSVLRDRFERARSSETTAIEHDDEREVLFAPAAAGRLVRGLVTYLEADAVATGLSPFAVGDRFGPDALSIRDTVTAGGFAALAYDTEIRPTTPVSLVERGRISTLLHDSVSAIDHGARPAGSVLAGTEREFPPRIAPRHLDVASGSVPAEELRERASVVVERLGMPRWRNETTRTLRSSHVPPDVHYAATMGERAPDGGPERLSIPIEEGYLLSGEERGARLDGASVEVEPSALRGITALGEVRETLTGTVEKHRTTLPFEVTSPAIVCSCRLR